jgi:hypothetical protein
VAKNYKERITALQGGLLLSDGVPLMAETSKAYAAKGVKPSQLAKAIEELKLQGLATVEVCPQTALGMVVLTEKGKAVAGELKGLI